jgi:argininosuccinate lyase
VRVNSDRTRDAATAGYLNATDLADYLVRKGLEFRKAHEVVGRVVMHAIEHGKAFEEVTLEEYRKFSELFGDDLYASLSLDSSLAIKRAVGGTSPVSVQDALVRARREFE